VNDKEMRELDIWISLNVTKTLRRLSDAEYAEVVKDCEGVNLEPHPNLELTQPSRFEGILSKHTDPADVVEVLKACLSISVEEIHLWQGHSGRFYIESDKIDAATYSGIQCKTLGLAVFTFAKNLFSRGT
jgi:hypothetical protein